MVRIASSKRRGFLRQIAEGAKRSSATLKEALIAAQGQIYQPSFQSGRILVSTSGNGQSGSFEFGVAGKEWTQDNIFGLLEELIELCDRIVATGIADDGTRTVTDALFAAMIDDDVLRSLTTQMGDWSGLNFPATSLK